MKNIRLQNELITFGYIPTEDDEPTLTLRARDPVATDAILAYLKKTIESDSVPNEYVTELLEVLFQFKNWRAGSAVKGNKPSFLIQREMMQLESMRNFLERNGGFCKRSNILNAYRIPAKELDRILPRLGVHVFKIRTAGCPATYYVLPDRLERFHRYAAEQDWTITQTAQSADLLASSPTRDNSGK